MAMENHQVRQLVTEGGIEKTCIFVEQRNIQANQSAFGIAHAKRAGEAAGELNPDATKSRRDSPYIQPSRSSVRH